MAKLKYKIKVHRGDTEIRVGAEPSEWATESDGAVTWAFTKNNEPEVRVNWSCGGRNWTIDDARTFFKASLKMLDRLEKELKYAKVVAIPNFKRKLKE